MKEGLYLVNNTDIIFELVNVGIFSFDVSCSNPIDHPDIIVKALNNKDFFYIGEL